MRITLPLLFASTALFGAPSLDKRVKTLETQMQDLRMQSAYGNYGANTASAYPKLNSFGLIFSAEALYWQFFSGGTEYVFQNEPNPTGTYVDQMNGMTFDWRPAYRFTLGYQLPEPDFQLTASFTRFTTDQSVHTSGSIFEELFPNQAFAANADYTGASESWKIFYNVLDLNLSRPYFLRRTFSAHPFIGIRGALIDQRNTIGFEGSLISDFNDKSTNNFSGIGLVGGTQGRWHFDSNWSLFGSLLGSLLYGWYDIQTTIQRVYPSLSNSLILSSDIRRFVPNMGADVGFRWEQIAFQRRTRFAVSVAYEFQYWWAQNQLLHTDEGTTYSWTRWAEDFGMHGVKLNLGLNF